MSFNANIWPRRFFLHCLVALGILAAGVLVEGHEISRIINGITTTVDKVQYIVQLRDSYGRLFCGGTLISPKYVITAAHCFINRRPQNIRVVGGASAVTEPGVERRIRKLSPHPHFGLSASHADIAVIELDSEMSGDNITTVPLCEQPLLAAELVQVSGWGKSEQEDLSQQLRTVTLPVTSQEVCENHYGRLAERNLFCASGFEDKGACFGDSGGPAIHDGQLCGVVSIAYQCGEAGYPGGFTDVYEMRSYIESVMKR